jgi:outer membrane protein TolC
MVGVGANAIFGLSDAIFAPLATAQELQARQASQQAVTNDVTLGVAESYFLLVQARGDFSAAEALVREGEELSRKTDDIAEGLAPPVEAARTRVELARRKQATITAKERWRTASAELSRLLRLDPLILLDPMEPANMAIPVIDGNAPIDDLIRLALTHRPELAANQSLVQATLQRLKQEKLRPLTPSILLRSTSTNPSGSLGFGVFGGGPNNRLGEFNTRFDYDVQILWELQNLGFGNRNRIRERNVEHEIATLELFRTQDRIAAEVSVAFAQLNAARDRLRIAEPAFAEAYDTFRKNSDALSQTRRIGNAVVLVSRPQEVVAALQALANSNSEYLAAVSDFNRVQFRLYRAIGHPATFIVEQVQPEVAPAASRAGPR